MAGDVLLIIDFKNQVFRATSTHASLFSGRTFTGGVYGFIVAMLRAVRDTTATRVAVATDSPPYLRKAEFDGYKANRKAGADEAVVMKAAQSMPIIKDLLEVLDIPFWEAPQFEYDDICSWAVRQYAHRYTRTLAMTNDSDLYQLFDVPTFALYRGAERGVYGRDEFVAEFGELTRDEWVQLLSMTGTHNAVPGIDGIGPKKALKALRTPALLRELEERYADIIDRNKPLIRLPHRRFPKDAAFRLRPHRFETTDFMRFCDRYDIQTTAPMLEALRVLRHKG